MALCGQVDREGREGKYMYIWCHENGSYSVDYFNQILSIYPTVHM